MKKLLIAAVAAAFVMHASLALAGTGAVKLPPYKESKLGNGLRVFVMETTEVPLVTVALLVPSGSAADGPGAEGVANLTGRLLLKGAGGMSAEQIADAIEEVGGNMSVNTTRDYTVVFANFMAKDLSRALDIMSKAVLTPAFPAEELAREKGLVTAEIAGIKENPMAFASREAVRVLVGDHPYAHPVDGSATSVEDLTRDGVLAYYKANYVPAGAIVAVVGNVKSAQALDLVKARFGSWKGAAPAREIPALEPKKLPGRRVFVVDKKDATQSQIRIGNIAVPRNTPDYFPLVVSNTILGGGFTSRLMNEIRVNRGLSYGARSGVTHMKHGGFFTVLTYTKNETMREAIDVCLNELKKLRDERIGDEELTSNKKYISGLFPFDIETNNDLAGWLVDLTYNGVPLTFIEEYQGKVAAVTPDDCMRVARAHYWLDDNLLFLMTSYDETKEQLQGLGNVEVVGIDKIE